MFEVKYLIYFHA